MATGSLRRQHTIVNGFRYASAIIRWIIEPPASVEEKQRRRVRLLSAFLLLITINTLIGAIIIKNAGNSSWPIMLVTAAILAAGYVLNRTGYYRLATVLAVTIPAFPIFAMALFSTNKSNIPYELPWLALPLLISSILISLRRTIIIAIIYVAFIVLLIPFADVPAVNMGQSLAFLFMIFFFVVAVTAVRRHDQSEVERQLTERKQVEEALRDSEADYRRLFKLLPVGITILDLKGVIIYCNSAVYNKGGYSEGEFTGKHFSKISSVRIRDIPKYIRLFNSIARGKTPEPFEAVYQRKDGTAGLTELHVDLVKVGGKQRILVIQHDLTERKRAEQTLRDSEEKFSVAFRSSPEAIIISRLKDNMIIEVNESFTRFTGYTREEAINHNADELNFWVYEEERSRMLEIWDEQGRVYNEEFHSRKKSGEISVGLFSGELINIGGEPCLNFVITDITEQKRAEKLQNDENHVLTLLGQGAELSELLDAIVRLGESYNPAVKGSVMLYDSSKELLFIAAAPSLSASYIKSMENGITIGPNMGSCGTAAYLKERVIVPDIENSPLFPYKEVTDQIIGEGLLACWSQPIISSSGELLGTIANYSLKTGEPDSRDLRVLEWSAHIASIAIERKAAEEALAKEAIRRRILIEQSRDGIVVLDQNGNVYESNQRFAEMLGYSLEEVRHLCVWDWEFQFPPEQVLDMVRSVDETGDHFETQHRRKDGTIYDVEISTNGAVFAGEKLIFCVCRDITERKRREQLRNDENYVLTLLGQGAELSEVLDAIMRLGESHDPSIKGSVMLFDSSKELLFMAAAPSLSASYIKSMENGIAIGPNMGSCGTAAYLKERVIVPDIENSPLFPYKEVTDQIIGEGLLACWSQPIISSSGELLGTIANYSLKTGEPDSRDLRVLEWSAHIASIAIERKAAEEALKESEAKLSKAFNASPETIVITTLKDGVFLEVNDSFTRITGYTHEEVIGRSSADINIWAHAEDRARMLQILKKKGRVYTEEFKFRMRSGEIRTWLFSAEKINIGGELCLISITADITKRKLAEENLKKALSDLEQSSARLAATNKELETFSYSVSHDMRSPLRSIDGFSQALLEDYNDKLDENGQDYLKRLRGASQKMGELIDGLLKLSRLTRSEMHVEPVDLSELAEEITARLKETRQGRRAKFIIDKGLTAQGDPELVRVLLENLLGNAWKFTSKNRHAIIEFGATRNNGKKTYFVKDNGVGFDMTYADKLFGAFQRLHNSTDYPGTGIGLATALRIINRHGGAIQAEGAVGKGATFYFTLD